MYFILITIINNNKNKIKKEIVIKLEIIKTIEFKKKNYLYRINNVFKNYIRIR